jgi:hypothetical protein
VITLAAGFGGFMSLAIIGLWVIPRQETSEETSAMTRASIA